MEVSLAEFFKENNVLLPAALETAVLYKLIYRDGKDVTLFIRANSSFSDTQKAEFESRLCEVFQCVLTCDIECPEQEFVRGDRESFSNLDSGNSFRTSGGTSAEYAFSSEISTDDAESIKRILKLLKDRKNLKDVEPEKRVELHLHTNM
ncbi:MAG: hypothetical protein LBR54_04385, partial [Oscillospiraceae bacterium]|nr:hypothetical protein [Oscillospiraceae bacterium]